MFRPSLVTLVSSLSIIVRLTSAAPAVNQTVNNNELQTVWFPTGEVNTKTAVQPGNVRQSHLYTVRVSPSSSLDWQSLTTWYDSFVHETIPRNGNGKIYKPGDTGTTSDINDGISIEPAVGISMAWTQFQYAQDVMLNISRTDGRTATPSNIVIRPTTLQYNVQTSGSSTYIHVPYGSTGTRFSIEFQDDLWTYRTKGSDYSTYSQNVAPDGPDYVSAYTDDDLVVGIEPRNALLVFASTFPSSDLVPQQNVPSTYSVPTGLVDVNNLKNIGQSTVYFAPGVYYMTGTAHANFSSSVNWVYLAPGAYVKGAIQYTTSNPDLRFTGFGVLSGEQYVYQANTDAGYTNTKSDGASLHMIWSQNSVAGQAFTCSGPTLNAPPFNSMDLSGDTYSITSRVWDYKQVGAFFWQTDGMEIYPGSQHHDIFYHSNDDSIKTYYSNVNVENVTVWKGNNGGVIQMGWSSRDISNITVSDLNVIHTRYPGAAAATVPTLVGASPDYRNTSLRNTADTSNDIANYNVNNLRCEGICPSLIILNPLQNFDNFTINGAHLDSLTPVQDGAATSHVYYFTDINGNGVSIGADSPNGVGLTIRDFEIGGTRVSFAANNWNDTSLGRLYIDGEFGGHWTVE
ncbi:MAG: hypothetical protein M1820_001563 [Bogoriella megaspora]|nr:MAG: hypothetical protein M1820_001563 [Bogoriella megaspora]